MELLHSDWYDTHREIVILMLTILICNFTVDFRLDIVGNFLDNRLWTLVDFQVLEILEVYCGDIGRSMPLVDWLKEQEPELVDNQITELFHEIDEKPSFEAFRIGLQTEKEKIRPVKISLRNAETVHRILTKAKNLKNSEKYRKVYISPDRTLEERRKHKQLVAEMRQLATDNPDQNFFIFRGEICKRDK